MGLGFLVSDNATEHLVGDEERKAELFLTKSATAGFVDAQCSLGKMLANEGRGSAKRFTGSSKPLRRIMEVLNIS
jgi:TPR repeat protein